MNRRLLIFKYVLALLFICSGLLLSAHAANHIPSSSASCVLCISHGNASNAITPTATTLSLTSEPAVADSGPGPGRPVRIDDYRTPARAPPLSI